jgi:hypothetical protein
MADEARRFASLPVQTVQRYPAGLLSWLNMKGTGDTPHELARVLYGMLDLSELYGYDQQTSNIVATAVMTGLGTWPAASGLVVPPGEVWLLKSMNAVTGTLAAATTYKGRCCILRASSIAGIYDLGDHESSATTGERWAVSWTLPPPGRLMRQGDGLGVYVSAATVGTAAATSICATYVRLLV